MVSYSLRKAHIESRPKIGLLTTEVMESSTVAENVIEKKSVFIRSTYQPNTPSKTALLLHIHTYVHTCL